MLAERKAYPANLPVFLHVTEDPERDWELLRPHAIYEMQEYQSWGLTGASSYGDMELSDETLRAANAVLTPEQMLKTVLGFQRDFPHCTMSFYTLLAGMDPEMAQSSLELIAQRVLPALHKARQSVA